jgi:EAL domain-containing protein (putative c-di-GMP-specific phosphodiesterase class I)
MELRSRLSEMCFYEQPIFRVEENEQKTIFGYELLLRKNDGENAFPAMLFREYMYSSEANTILCRWIAETVGEIAAAHPTCHYSFNLDPQQLLYEGTVEELAKLAPYADQIAIEITEGVPAQRDFTQYYNPSLLAQVKALHEIGFSVRLDDVSSGLNSFNTVRNYIERIDGIKLSLIQFRNTDCELVVAALNLWQTLATHYDIKLIIEGVDGPAISDSLVKRNLNWQQGFFLGMPEAINQSVNQPK